MPSIRWSFFIDEEIGLREMSWPSQGHTASLKPFSTSPPPLLSLSLPSFLPFLTSPSLPPLSLLPWFLSAWRWMNLFPNGQHLSLLWGQTQARKEGMEELGAAVRRHLGLCRPLESVHFAQTYCPTDGSPSVPTSSPRTGIPGENPARDQSPIFCLCVSEKNKLNRKFWAPWEGK